MKSYKKIALLAIIFILSTVLNVYAADSTTTEGTTDASIPEVIVTPSTTTAKLGETVTITIVAKYGDIEGFDGILTWDATKLEFTNAAEVNESTGGLSDFFEGETGKYLLTKMAASSTKDELSVATLKFKVLDKATVGEKLTVVISDIEVGGYDGDVADKTVEITVVEGTVAGDEGTSGGENNGTENEGTGTEGENGGTEDSGTTGENNGTTEENTGTTGGNTGTTTDEEKKDTTTADKDFNKAGLVNFAPVAVAVIVVLAIAFYSKCKKYRDIK